MKKLVLAMCVAFLGIPYCQAQKKSKFEGIIKYDLLFDNAALPPEAIAMLKGAASIVSIKGEKRRVDMVMAIQSTSSYMDAQAKTMVNTMSMGKQKMLIKMTEADIKEERENAPTITIHYLKEKKKIAGYSCKKAEVISKNKNGSIDTIIVFYTAKIPTYPMKEVFPGLKGFPLEYAIMLGGVKMTFVTKSISKEPVPDAVFEIPKEGYIETTMEELKKSMGEGE
jgi:GLPGLI family protein